MKALGRAAARGTRGWRATAVVTAGLLLASVPVAAAEAHNVKVRHSLFGMHDATDLSYSRLHEGSIRFWDTGTQWRDIETSRGTYNWTRLDTLVTAAQQHHASATFVIGDTPSFYAKLPTNPPRNLAVYRAFVTHLMKRYKSFHGKRGIDTYQVWNEANIKTFWTGTPAQMAKMTQIVYQVRNKVDPRARVLAPEMVSRLSFEQQGIGTYYRQKVNGTPVWKFVDAISLSDYPMATYGSRPGGPEDMIALVHQVRRILHKAGVPRTKPIWSTELNYGLLSGKHATDPAKRIPASLQAAYVMRTYLLSAADGISRVYLYRYDLPDSGSGGPLANTLLSNPSDFSQVTAAGLAYARVQHWMHGTLLGGSGGPCPKDSHGTYHCQVKDGSGTRSIYWNPRHKATVKLAKSARHKESVLGAVTTVKGGSKITVNRLPVYVYH